MVSYVTPKFDKLQISYRKNKHFLFLVSLWKENKTLYLCAFVIYHQEKKCETDAFRCLYYKIKLRSKKPEKLVHPNLNLNHRQLQMAFSIFLHSASQKLNIIFHLHVSLMVMPQFDLVIFLFKREKDKCETMVKMTLTSYFNTPPQCQTHSSRRKIKSRQLRA